MPSSPVANTFLIGAQKAGTTYLAAMLDRHASVCVSHPKEPHFLSGDHVDDMDAYARCFCDPDAPIRVDASTTYSFLRPARDLDREGAPGLLAPVPRRIAEIAPEAKLIYILRDPVARAKSAYRHNRRRIGAPEGPVSLAGALREDPMLVLAGRYADQIDRYLEVFAPDQFLFLDFAELTRDPATALDKTCTFLGLSSEGMSTEIDEGDRNLAHELNPAGRRFHKMAGLRSALRRIVPSDLRRSLKARFLVQPAPEVTFTDVEEAESFFVDDRARLPGLTGLSI
ncbi:sulfotransferase domain-containing protein [Palleronia sp. LCG004]|uniref:sulfotransferase domain-containing protein n=1 Tax=Palleronia sp. LCG004 TaxID=3079304 RepID=UPI002941D674|nr:sulfotransferase domain-containing protein [Palleronia sp. LCG004]WOI58413.1 sulfotransferase [Palleronia sp. LCG004]